MSLTNALLHELSSKSLEESLELARLALRSSACIPRKREVILLWLQKSIRQQTQDNAAAVLPLWKLLHEVLQDAVPEQLEILVQNGFLEVVAKGIQMQLRPDPGHECHTQEVAMYLLQKTPQKILFLRLHDMESMLLILLKCCCDILSEGKDGSNLIAVLSLLLGSIASAWQKHPYSWTDTTQHLKPLLGFMMMLLKLTENSTSAELTDIRGQIKKVIVVALFNKKKLDDWIHCLVAHLEVEGNVRKGTCASSEVKESVPSDKEIATPANMVPPPESGPGDKEIATPANMVPPPEPPISARSQELLSQECLVQIKSLVDGASESMESRGYFPADYVPQCLPVVLEGFMSFNRSGNLHCSVVLLAYFVSLLGIRCDVPFKAHFEVLKLNKRQKQSCFNKLLQVYEASEEYSAMMALPQKKNGAFKPKTWFRALGTYFGYLDYRTPAWFACVNTAMSISPNLVEGIMVKALQRCWATRNLTSADMKKVQDIFLVNVVHTYEKLFRIPKLLRNIFSSLSPLEGATPGPLYVTSSFLNTFAKCCTVMSSGQLTECWSLFLDQLAYWVGKSKGGEGNMTREISTTVEIFCTFLYHIQAAAPTMPAVDVKKINQLMEKTPKVASEMLDCSIEGKLDECAHCALLILHAWGEVHIVLQSYRRSYSESNSKPVLEASINDKDLSYLHPVLTGDKITCLLPEPKDSKEVLYVLFLLQIQKVRALLMCNEATSDATTDSIAAAATFIFSNTSIMSSCKAWDERVCRFTEETFSTAALNLLLSYSPLLVSCLTSKNLVHLCEWILHILQDSHDATVPKHYVTPKAVVTEYLSSSSFKESKPMQTAFITALFRNLSESIKAMKRSHDTKDATPAFKQLFDTLSSSPATWKKYAETIPELDHTSKKLVGPDDLNKMWGIIHDASQLLSVIMSSSESSERVTAECLTHALQAMEFLPLEDLFPGNQTRCLVGFIGVLFLLKTTLRNITSQSDKVMLTKATCNLLITLLDGTRRPWLLDFLDGSLLFNKIVLLLSEDFPQDLDDTAPHGVYEELLNRIARDAFRKRNTVRAFTPLVKQLGDVIPTCDAIKSKPLLAAAIVLFNQFVMEVSKKFLHQDTRPYIQKSALVLSKTFSSWLTQFLEDRTQHIEGRSLAFQISALQIKYAVAAHRLSTEDMCEEPCNKAVLSVLSMAWTDVMESKANAMMHQEAFLFLSVALKYRHMLTAFPDLSVPDIWMSADFVFTTEAKRLSECTSLTVENCLSEKQVIFLQEIFKCCTPKEITDMLEKLLILMLDDEAHSHTAKVHLRTFEVLCASLPNNVEDSGKEMADILQKFIEHFSVTLTFLNVTKDDELVTRILGVLATLLYLRKPSITHQSSAVILQVLCALDLGTTFSEIKFFCECYLTVCRMLSDFLQHRVYVIAGCASIIHTCIAMLIRSLVKFSSVDEVKGYPSEVISQLQKCASSLERLATLVSEHTREFGKIAPFLVAEYVTGSVNLTLYPPIKQTLMFVMHKLFSISSEPSNKMVLLTLPKEGTEVFKLLYSNSKKMCFRGKV